MKLRQTRRDLLFCGLQYALLFWGRPSSSWAQTLKQGIDRFSDALQRLKPGEFLWAPSIAPSGPILAVVSLPTQRCYVYRNAVLIGISTISSSKAGDETPTGIFTVLQKQVHHKSSLYDSAPMPYMQRLTWSGVAMHAGNLPGFTASHGGVRMPMAFAKLMYATTSLGMTVVITKLDEVPRVAPTPDLLQSEASTEKAKDSTWIWQPEKSSSGPVSLILSGADRRLVVLRNGIPIGSSPVTITGDVTETAAYSLTQIDAKEFHWMQLHLPGESWGVNKELTSERSRVHIPDAFRALLDGELTPGVTLVVTTDSLRAGATGRNLTVLEAQP